MILMKFKEYTIQIAISVKTNEMGNKDFPEQFFLEIVMAKRSTSSSLEALGLILEQDFIRIIACDHILKAEYWSPFLRTTPT